MEFSIVKLFPDNLVQALCNTLIHSLWQGLVLSAITALIIVFTRKSTPARRYNLLISALVLFAAATVVTFVISLKHAPVSSAAQVNYNNDVILNMQPANFNTPVIQKTAFTDAVIGYFNRNSATIVLIWFMIVCARCLQLATGLQGIYYLRNKSIFKADEYWDNRVHLLAQSLGIRRVVRIAESGLAKVPMVVGHLKPLILIPVGLLTAMATEEIEAILVHELAHIRRSDYLVNLLQSLLEIIFFFNPAVLWISALIKTERENCCDDIAVSQSSSKVNYIKALVSCQEYNASSPALAMALKGQRNHLKNRVTRIISNNNQSLNRMEKATLAICLVTAGLLTAAFTNAEKINKLVANTAKAVSHAGSVIKKEILPETKQDKAKELKTVAAKADTTTKNKLRIYNPAEVGDHTSVSFQNGVYNTRLYKEKGILYQLNYRHNVLASMQVDGKTVPADKIAGYQPIVDGIPHENRTEYGEIHDAADDRAHVTESAHDANANYDNGYRNNYNLDSAKAKMNAQTYKPKGPLGKLDGKLGALDYQKSNYQTDSASQTYKKSAKNYIKIPVSPYYPKNGAFVKKPIDYKPYVSLKDDERRDKMIGELMNDGIITSKDNLSFKISTSEFIVNGKKQPDAVYQKYKVRFVKNTNGEWSWMYNYDDAARRETNSITDEPNKH